MAGRGWATRCKGFRWRSLPAWESNELRPTSRAEEPNAGLNRSFESGAIIPHDLSVCPTIQTSLRNGIAVRRAATEEPLASVLHSFGSPCCAQVVATRCGEQKVKPTVPAPLVAPTSAAAQSIFCPSPMHGILEPPSGVSLMRSQRHQRPQASTA